MDYVIKRIFCFFVFSFLISLNVYASEILSSALLGCSERGLSFTTQVYSAVDIAHEFLVKSPNQDQVIHKHIETQLKHWVGISKKFQSKNISKISLSAYRKNQSILGMDSVEYKIPELEAYWNKNINYGEEPYIKHLISLKPGPQKFKRIKYQINLALSVCARDGVSTQQALDEIQKLPLPRDPYLTFWVNSKSERAVRELPGIESGFVANCISDDFLIYGTNPSYGWFYWEPVHDQRKVKCETSQSHLLTTMSFKLIGDLQETPVGNAFTPTEQIRGSVIFGVVQKPSVVKVDRKELLKEIKNRIDQCAQLDTNDCIGRWKNIPGQEVGQNNLLSFLQYTSVLFKKMDYRVLQENADFFILRINAISRTNNKAVQLDLYHGPTSIFKSLLAPPDYWNFVRRSLYEADFLTYFGHAGLGENLDLKTISTFSNDKTKFKLRTRDLLLGMFNCEGSSYHGFGYDELYKPTTERTHYQYLVASSGAEVRSHFVLGFIEQILNGNINQISSLKKEMGSYVKTQDFLTFQKIKIEHEIKP